MTIRVAIASSNGTTVHQHFGHATHFRVYALGDGAPELVEVRESRPTCGPGEEREDSHDRTLGLLSDCAAVIVSCIGPSALRQVKARGLACFVSEGLIDEVLEELSKKLRPPVNAGRNTEQDQRRIA
jgi:predicted Fe-Mo cluster-binding NifX family protein